MYRRNYRSKSSIKSEFSPSLRKASTPNYYQRKGRTLQQSPLYLKNIPTEIMTRKKLEKLYRILVQYKYQFPGRPISIPIQPFTINTIQSMYLLFPEIEQGVRNYHFDNQALLALASSNLSSSYPEIFNSYLWTFQLLNIQFQPYTTPTIDDNRQYFINWNSNLLLNSPYQILIKSVNTGVLNTARAAPIEIRPNGVNSETGNVILRAERVSVTSGGLFTVSANNIPSNDNNILDNAQYPFMDTGAGESDLYHGELEFVPSTGLPEGDAGGLRLLLYILCIPHSLT